MAARTGSDRPSCRLLCLGNDLLADDALGIIVADLLRQRVPASVEIIETMETGLSLMDYLADARHVIVVDTVITGKAKPGTVYVLREKDFAEAAGSSPHYVGLFEGLSLARLLGLEVPEEVVIVAVEGADCHTVGGKMSQEVKDAIPVVLRKVRDVLASMQNIRSE
jgi:hydrogenase maturation protease